MAGLRAMAALVAALMSGFAAAQSADAGSGGPSATAWERHAAAGAEAARLDREACRARKGDWARHGDRERCVLPSADGGKVCRQGSDCELACVSRTDPRYSKTPHVVGECLRATALEGCFFYVEGGRVAHAVCRD